MASDNVENEVFSIIQSINRACVEGVGFDELAENFADDFITYQPGFSRCARGKENNLNMYKDFCSKANIEKFSGSDQKIDIYGDTAIVNYRYETQWEYQGTSYDENGHEIYVFKNNNGKWQAAWRSLIVGKRTVVGMSSEQSVDICPNDDIRSQCIDLITNTPVCELTTINAKGFPYTTAMNNLRDKNLYPDLVDLFDGQDNDFIIYMSTSNKSAKMTRILANPKVSVYFCNDVQHHGLMLGGEIEIISDQELKNKIWQKGWTMYYPNGPEGPEYGVIKLSPTIVKGWNCTGKFELNPSRQ
jgi:general stress protein 26